MLWLTATINAAASTTAVPTAAATPTRIHYISTLNEFVYQVRHNGNP